ncbi:MAG: GTPase HflX [Thermoplasmatales archaeon]|nr:MAG: GTPase HflX [Thermoplasmatales archaeon]
MNNTKNAIIISISEDISETIDLADSLDYKAIKTFIQKRKTPDVNSYIGRGKLDEIIDYISNKEINIDLIIINGDLKPSQWFNLEKKLGINVYDRIRLILDIFEKRADRREAKLQVKLAQLGYERPFVREIIHRARAGEHPGFMAGGEYQVDDYYEMIKKQIKKIKRNLDTIRDEREIRRRHRHISGFYLVSLAGYTNAGKSSLLNLLSGEKVKVEGKLFSTLSTTTRRVKNKNYPILLTDTVGFIQNLPALIIDAFHSTLEEISVADIVLLLVDISENEEIVNKKLNVSFNELIEIGVKSPIIIVLNKSDLLSKKDLDKRINLIKKQDSIKKCKIVPLSVKNNENIDNLLNVIFLSFPQISKSTIKLPINKTTQSLISWIYDIAHVIDISYDEFITITFECNIIIRDKIISRCLSLNGKLIE